MAKGWILKNVLISAPPLPSPKRPKEVIVDPIVDEDLLSTIIKYGGMVVIMI